MKNRIINWTLKDRKEINTVALDIIKNNMKNDVRNINYSLAMLKNLEEERVILEEDQDEINISKHENKILFDKINEIENEFIDINCNLIPFNYFTLEPYSKYIEYKNNILNGICDFIKNNFKTQNIEKYICIFSINNQIRISDLDNYFCKPFLDGIVLSRIVTSDSSNNISIIYTKNEDEKSPLNIKIINKKFADKHLDIIKRCLF